MAVHDIRSDIQQNLAFLAAIGSDTTTNGFIFDTADFENGLMFAPFSTAYTDGTYDFTIEEGEDSGLSDATAVPTAKLIGSLADLQQTAVTAEGDVLKTIGVFSNKRYVRINVVSTSVTTGATLGVVVSQRGENMPVV
jgi:hypothetical protein